MSLKKKCHLAVSEEVHRYAMKKIQGKNDYWCVDDLLRDSFGLKRERA